MRVLVVDRDPLFSRLIETKLKNWGHRVTVEHDGSAAYKLIAKEPFRMVVMDYDLPGMDGWEICRRIRGLQRPRYTYILFYADFSEKNAVMACLEAGADTYLNKPLNSAEFRLSIRAYKRLLNLEDILLEGAGLDLSTGVINGASFRKFYEVAFADSERLHTKGSLLFIRVENYVAELRDHGFNPSEAMMAGLADLLSKIARASDLVARLSNDTFCVMLLHTNWDNCQPVADKIFAQAQNITVLVDGGQISPEVEITASNFPNEGTDYLGALDQGERIAYRRISQADHHKS